jgi:hypothetical protein
LVSAVGDSDLSPGQTSSSGPQGLAGRGLVVFPAAHRGRRRGLGWYAPFLATVVVGAIVVAVVVLVR